MAHDRWFSSETVDIEELRRTTSTDGVDAPTSAVIECGVPIYDAADLSIGPSHEPLPTADRRLLGELASVLADGPGILVVKRAVETAVVDATTESFLSMIEAERDSDRGSGDHFAAEGSNDRVWNAMEKLAIGWPEIFAEYYSAPVVDVVSRAWLGPGYQITSQVNVVKPGGKAQAPHRDYHLGFMSDAEAEHYPAHVHRLSPSLTLQGAVAHDPMPLETGPTTYLPHSQKFGPGYVAWRRDDVRSFYEEHHVQLPLEKGDAVFFNPALLHGAGTNRTQDRRRMANLLQVSSPFGRAMEAMNRRAMCRAVTPVLMDWKAGGRSSEEIARVIAAVAEGYSFPSDLDTDQRTEGLAPPSQAALLHAAIETGKDLHELDAALDAKARAQGLAG
jgi:ectoine hydroxylase-related dioxygenase (phytanoyl-CoA dioxygenase family)